MMMIIIIIGSSSIDACQSLQDKNINLWIGDTQLFFPLSFSFSIISALCFAAVAQPTLLYVPHKIIFLNKLAWNSQKKHDYIYRPCGDCWSLQKAIISF